MLSSPRSVATARRAVDQCGIFFFCGPDEAGASAAAQSVTELLADAGERIEISGGDLKKDPALLGDEARSGSLFGGKRHIYVRANGDEAHEALKTLIETSDAGAGEAAPVLVVATAATDKSRTAKLLEKRKDALVAMFWPPDLSTVAASVRTMAGAVGLKLGGDLADLASRFGLVELRESIAQLCVHRRRAHQGHALVVVDKLDIDILVRAVHRHPWTLGGSAHLLAHAPFTTMALAISDALAKHLFLTDSMLSPQRPADTLARRSRAVAKFLVLDGAPFAQCEDTPQSHHLPPALPTLRRMCSSLYLIPLPL